MTEMTRLQRAYQTVFKTEEGELVLSDILSMLGFFSNIPERIDPRSISIANTILSRLNVYGESGVGDYVRAMLSQARIPEDKEDDAYGME